MYLTFFVSLHMYSSRRKLNRMKIVPIDMNEMTIFSIEVIIKPTGTKQDIMKIFATNNCISNITKTLFLYLFISWTMYGKVLIVPEECFVVTVTLLVSFPSVGYSWDDLFPAWLTAHWLYEDVTTDPYYT